MREKNATKTSSTSPEKVWYLYCGAGTLKSGAWHPYIENEQALSSDPWFSLSERLCKGKRFAKGEWSNPPPIFRHDKALVVPDVNQSSVGHNDPMLASPRLVAFLHEHAPGCIQDLPIRVRGPIQHKFKEFRLINWLRRSVVTTPRKRVACRKLLSQGVPAFVGVGKLFYHHGHVLVMDNLKRKIEKAGFVMFKFYPVEVDDPLPDTIKVYNHRTKTHLTVPRRAMPNQHDFDPAVLFKADLSVEDEFYIPGSDVLHTYIAWSCGGHRINVAIVRSLLKAGVRTNTPYAPNLQSLANSIHEFPLPLVRLLTKHGINWNVSNIAGATPLKSALSDGNFKGASNLLRHGADPSFLNVLGLTAKQALEADYAKWKDRRTKRAINYLTALELKRKPTSESIK